MKLYYDTGVFLWFLENKDNTERLNRVKETYQLGVLHNHRCISLYTTLEALHLILIGKIYPDKQFDKIWKEIETLRGAFRTLEFDSNILNSQINALIYALTINQKIDIKIYKKIKKLNSLDWAHLVMAEIGECEEFLTNDSGFLFLDSIKQHLKFEKLKRIVIFKSSTSFRKFLNQNDLEIDKIIELKSS